MGATTAIIAGIGIQAYGQYRGLRSAEAAADFQAGISRQNAKIKKERIKDITAIGLAEEKLLEREAIEFAAEQVTGFASGGIDVASAVVGEAVEETARIAAADIITLQHNIKRAVWNEEVGIMSDELSALFNRIQARSAGKLAPITAAGTILTGVGLLGLRGTTSPLVRTAPPGSGTALGLSESVSINLPGGP